MYQAIVDLETAIELPLQNDEVATDGPPEGSMNGPLFSSGPSMETAYSSIVLLTSKLPDGMGGKGLVYSLEASPPSGDASPSHHGLHLSMKSPPSSPAAASSSSASCSPSHQMVSNLPSSAMLQQPSSSSQLSNPTTGFATILATAPTGSSLSPSVQISTFHPASTETTASGGQTPQVYRIPAQGSGGQAFSLAISGPSKSSSNNSSTSTQSQIMPNTSHQNLSLVSGNVVIPAGQTILQTGSTNGAFMYHTGQGLVYATPTTLPEGGVILNIGQEQGGTPQQFITIPVSLSLTPAQQQQLMHVSPTALAATCQVTGCSPAKSHKSRK